MKKTIVTINGLRVVGEIDSDLVDEYIRLTIPLGVEVLIGNNIEDIIQQIGITLKQQGNRYLELNDNDSFKECVKRIRKT